MALRDLDGRVPQQNRNVRNVDALEQQRHREGIAETMGVTAGRRSGDEELFRSVATGLRSASGFVGAIGAWRAFRDVGAYSFSTS